MSSAMPVAAAAAAPPNPNSNPRASLRHVISVVNYICNPKVTKEHYSHYVADDLNDLLINRLLYCYIDSEAARAKASETNKVLDFQKFKDEKRQQFRELLNRGDFQAAAEGKDRNQLWNIVLRHPYSKQVVTPPFK